MIIITSLHENELGSKGRPYPDISNMTTTHDVRKMRPGIKILTGHDYKDMA